ncbi:MAG: YihY/virulence factor BrkB family protein [Bacteroidales bacterium]|nr:YihY/virulence factor BrkB family protein [Bacteroidales bacterium]
MGHNLRIAFFAISFIYYLAPQRKSAWRFFSIGSLLAGVLTIITTLGFSYFVNNFAEFNKIFGSIGALIALMLWLNFIAFSLLIGFELNASIAQAKFNAIRNNEEKPV